MKILHINSIGWRTWSAKLCETIVKWLTSYWIDNHTIVWYDFSEWKNPGIDSVFTTKNNLFHTYIYKFFVWLNFIFDFMRPGHLSYKTLKNNKYYKECDIIFIHCPEGGYFDWRDLPCICIEKKVVMILWDWIASGNDPHNYFFWKSRKSFQKRMLILQDLPIFHIAVSNRSSKKWKEICWFKNIHTIYNGIDTNQFHQMNKLDCRKKLWLPLDKKIILSISWSGSKSNLKGIKYVEKIINEFKNNNDYFFVSIWNGKTNKINNYRELWLIPYNQINLYYNAIDCFLYPTLADNCPLVILENFACGSPIITFDVWGVTELVQHKKNWYVSKYKDYNDLLNGFRRVINNRDKLNIVLDKKFTQEYMVKEYIIFFQSLI